MNDMVFFLQHVDKILPTRRIHPRQHHADFMFVFLLITGARERIGEIKRGGGKQRGSCAGGGSRYPTCDDAVVCR